MKKILLAAAVAFCSATVSLAQNSWTMKVLMKSGELKEIPCNDIQDVTFANGESASYYADVKVTHTYNLYYGAVTTQAGLYTLHLCDGELTTGGLPTQINKHDVRLTVIATPSQDADHAKLPAGTYPLVESANQSGVWKAQSIYIETNRVNDAGQVDGFLDSLSTCVLNVEEKGDGNYHLVLEGTLKTHGKVRFVYDGALTFVNKDKNAGYKYVTEDVNFVPVKFNGKYVKATSKYCDYTIAFLNCEVDDQGFVVGDGELLNLVLLTKYQVPMDINTIAGTYDVVMPVAGAEYKEGKFIGGTMRKASGTYYPIGSFYETLSDGYADAYGLLSGGTITVSVANNKITFKGNWTTPQGKAIKMDFTGDASAIIDTSESENGAPAQGDFGRQSIYNSNLNQHVNLQSAGIGGGQVYMMKR